MPEYPQQDITPSVGEGQTLSELLLKWGAIVRRFWYWFVLSMVLALVVGYVYVQSRDRVYSGRTMVLIESNDEAGYSSRGFRSKGSMNSLMQLGGISAGDNLENEMFILSSLRLMERVVEHLGLTTDYTRSQSLHTISLYGREPLQLHFEQPSPRYDRFTAILERDGSLTLSHFEGRTALRPEQQEQRITLRLGQRTMTPFGPVRAVRGKGFATLKVGDTFTIHHYAPRVAAQIYQNRIKASEHSKQSTLIDLSITDINRQRAEDILQQLCEVYKADIVENKNRVAQSTARFIDNRIALISSELSQVEQQQAAYKQQHKIVDMLHTAQHMGQLSLQARQRTQEVSTQLSVAEWVVSFLREQGTKHEVIPTVVSLPSPAVSQQIVEYNRLALDRGRVAANSSEVSTTVRELDRQLSSLRAAILSALVAHTKSLRLEQAAAQREESSLSTQASGLPSKERAMAEIARQQGLKENLYTYLLNKREEVALQLAIEEANVRVVEAPLVGERPIAPRRNLLLGVALLVGLLLPALFFWVREQLDTTISTRAEVEQALDIPILGELPHMQHTTDATLVYAPDSDPNSPAAEAFRLLRYGLHFMNRDARVLLITSSTPSQGKSFVSRNLACSLAMTGKRVVLIDTDIRVRNLTRSFAPLHTRGLTEWLVSDEQEVQSLVCPDGVMKGVDFIPAGITPPNVTELLMHERFDQLIALLRERYDYVLLDTTPCFAVADASIVSRVADVTLLVMRVGRQLKVGLPAVAELHASQKIGRLCLVVNDCDVKAQTYGYGYQYGYAPTARRKWSLF